MHFHILVISLLAVAGSFLLEVRENGRVYLTALPSVELPETCKTRQLFGYECPGCGLTRSFIHLANRRWQASWQTHRLGWLIAMAALFQIPYRTHALRNNGITCLSETWSRRISTTLIVLLVLNWLAKLVMG